MELHASVGYQEMLDGAYQEILDNALAASDAQVVALSLLDPADETVRTVAWGAHQVGLVRAALTAVRRVAPDFEPTAVVTRADRNEAMARAYLRGEAVSCSLAEMATGIVPRVVVDVAARLVGIHRCFVYPLKVGRRVEGAMTFLTDQELPEGRRRVCAAFARQVALTLENARLLDEARRARAEIEAIFDATDDAVILFGPDGRIARTNQPARVQMAALVGRSLTDVRDLREQLRRVDQEELSPIVTGALAGRSASTVLVLRDQAGSARHFHAHAAPILDGDGSVGGAVLVARDITDLHRALTERGRLDGAVKTARLVAHELNNKLAYTVGFGSLLLENVAADSEASRFARAMVQGADEATQTVKRLQRLIRFEEVATPFGTAMLDLDASTRPERREDVP